MECTIMYTWLTVSKLLHFIHLNIATTSCHLQFHTYKVTAIPTLKFGNETWTLRKERLE